MGDMTSGTAREGGERNGQISQEFDWAEIPPSVAVVRLISTAKNCDPSAVEPLGESVDADALDTLLASMGHADELQFSHACTSIRLAGDGTAIVDVANC